MSFFTVVITNADEKYYAQLFVHPNEDNEIVLETVCLETHEEISSWAKSWQDNEIYKAKIYDKSGDGKQRIDISNYIVVLWKDGEVYKADLWVNPGNHKCRWIGYASVDKYDDAIKEAGGFVRDYGAVFINMVR